MKIKKFLISIFCVILVVTMLINNVSYADMFSDIESGMQNVSSGKDNFNLGGSIKSVIALIQYAGTGISIIMVVVLGIKYMIASSNDRAEIKKQVIPILIGAILLFGAVNIAGVIASFGNDMNS